MKLAIIGATGFIGSAILGEALDRGHQVTAIVRHPEKLPEHTNLTAQQGDVRDEAQVPDLVRGHEAVISAYSQLSEYHRGSQAGRGQALAGGRRCGQFRSVSGHSAGRDT